MTKGRAIWAAYNDVGALDVPCTNCEAQRGQWCTKPDGRVSRMPCVARIAAADITPTTTDYSEPRHPRKANP